MVNQSDQVLPYPDDIALTTTRLLHKWWILARPIRYQTKVFPWYMFNHVIRRQYNTDKGRSLFSVNLYKGLCLRLENVKEYMDIYPKDQNTSGITLKDIKPLRALSSVEHEILYMPRLKLKSTFTDGWIELI